MKLALFLSSLLLATALTAAQAAPSAAPATAPPEPPAPQPSAAVQKLIDQANQFLQARQPQEALKVMEQALATARQTADPVGQAYSLHLRAIVLQMSSRNEEALASWRAAAVSWRQIGYSPGQVEALARAALILARARPAEATALLRQALSLGKAETRRPRAAAVALSTQARAIFELRWLGPARAFWETARAIQERLAPGSPDLASSLNALGIVAFDQQDLAAARRYYQQALAIQEKLAPGSPNVAAGLNNLGLVAAQQGDLAGAKQYLQQVLAMQKRLVPGSREVAACLNSLGSVVWQQGDLAAAKEYGEQALGIQQKLSPDSLDAARSLNNLGLVAQDQGDLAEATQYHRQALAIREKLAPGSSDIARSLGNLGFVAQAEGDPAGAKQYHRQALAILERLAPGSLDAARSLGNLGVIAWQQGYLAEAKRYHQRALAIQEKLALGSLDLAATLCNLGTVAQYQGDLAGANRRFQQALAIQQKLAPGSLDLARGLYDLGHLAEQRHRLAEAERCCRQAWRIVSEQARSVSGDEARQAFNASSAVYAAALAGAQLALGKPAEAFTTMEEGRAQALRQLLLERQIAPRGADPQQWAAYQRALAGQGQAELALSRAGDAAIHVAGQLIIAQKQHAALPLLAPRQAAVAAARRQLESAQEDHLRAREAVAQRWSQIQKRTPRLFSPPVSLAQAGQLLPPGTLFVAFAVGDRQAHLFLLRRGPGGRPDLRTYTLPIREPVLNAQVRRLGLALSRPDPIRGSDEHALFTALFPPAARPWLRAARRLLISPDGPLWALPFAALVTNRSGAPNYLGLEKPLTYTPSLTLFAQTRSERPDRHPGQTLRALVVAPFLAAPGALVAARPSPEPEAGGERGLLLRLGGAPRPLPGSKTEAEHIARLYGCQPLLGAAATEAAVRRQIETADVVHLATHGYLQPLRAIDSGVLLAPPETEPPVGQDDNDGVLQAWEIASQIKLKADLVVLSACETGLGENVRSEGIVGLTRALQIAGARSVVASQWAVADESTARLMVAFHQKLRAGLPKDEALRQAMLQVARNPITAHPYYWAPFFLIGDPDNRMRGTAKTSPGRSPVRRAVSLSPSTH